MVAGSPPPPSSPPPLPPLPLWAVIAIAAVGGVLLLVGCILAATCCCSGSGRARLKKAGSSLPQIINLLRTSSHADPIAISVVVDRRSCHVGAPAPPTEPPPAPPPPRTASVESTCSESSGSGNSARRRGSIENAVRRSVAGLLGGRKAPRQASSESPGAMPRSASVSESSEGRDEGPPLHRNQCTKLVAAVEEILRTEGDYVLALRTLTTGYLPRLVPVLEGDERQTIFGNAETILGVHIELHARLEKAQAAPTLREEVAAVSSAFVTMLPFLKLYASYCANYVAALDALEHARTGRLAVADVIRRAEGEIATHRQGEGDLHLGACLIRPVKRLCLYPLLLTALLKEFAAAEKAAAPANDSSQVRDTLSDTAEAVQAMASQVNSMVLQAENRVRMMELHERLHGIYPGLVSPARRFVRTDRVQVSKHMLKDAKDEPAGGGSVSPPRKKYDIWLLSDRLLLTRPDRSARSALTYLKVKADMPLTDLELHWHLPASLHGGAGDVEEGGGDATPLPTSFWLMRGEGGSRTEKEACAYHVHAEDRWAAEQIFNAYEKAAAAHHESEQMRATQRQRLAPCFASGRPTAQAGRASSSDDLESMRTESMRTSSNFKELHEDGTLRKRTQEQLFAERHLSISTSLRSAGNQLCSSISRSMKLRSNTLPSNLPPSPTLPPTVAAANVSASGGPQGAEISAPTVPHLALSLMATPEETAEAMGSARSTGSSPSARLSAIIERESVRESSADALRVEASESRQRLARVDESRGSLTEGASTDSLGPADRVISLSRVPHASPTNLPPLPLPTGSTCSDTARCSLTSLSSHSHESGIGQRSASCLDETSQAAACTPPRPGPPPLLSASVGTQRRLLAPTQQPPPPPPVPRDSSDLAGRAALARHTSLLGHDDSSDDMLEAQLQHLQMIAELRISTIEARRSMAAQPPGGQVQDKDSEDSWSDEEGSQIDGPPSFTPALATAHL